MKSVEGKSHLLTEVLKGYKNIGFQAKLYCFIWSPKRFKIRYEFIMDELSLNLDILQSNMPT